MKRLIGVVRMSAAVIGILASGGLFIRAAAAQDMPDLITLGQTADME